MNKIGLLVFIILQAILWIYLGDAFIHPSKYVYTFGGDGSFIYYNMIFHTFFGDGFLLESMNFPKHESIFMTDAQASLALVYSILYDIWPSLFTPDAVVGFSHRFHYLMIGFAGVYFYKGLESLGVNKYTAGIAAVFITLLSPMMIRLAAGHFGLAYPFVFAFTFYFLIKEFLYKKFHLRRALAFALVILFFGMNNFYIGMINLTFSMLFALFMILLKEHRKSGIIVLSQVIGLILILYCAIHFTDPGMDRVEIQWGYEPNKAYIRSFIYPPSSLLFSLLTKFKSINSFGMESWMNLGFSTFVILGFGLLLILIRKVKFTNRSHLLLFLGLGASCFIMFLYASAFFYQNEFLKEQLFHEIGFLTMFKASARFAWPIYFTALFLAIYILEKTIKSLPDLISIILCGILIISSAYEAHLYLSKHVFNNKYGNPYSQASKKKYLKILDENKINLSDYQALYSVPVMEGWNDKFQIVPDFQAEFNSILLSMSSGLPMINGMLSRIGVTDAAKSIQLSASPLIEKDLLKELDSKKSILLVCSKEAANLTEGEKHLLDKSALLADEDGFQLRSLKIDSLDNGPTISKYRTYFDTLTGPASRHIHEGFDRDFSESSYAGGGSLTLNQDTSFFGAELSFPSDSIACSIYVKLNNEMFGNPQFDLVFEDKNGDSIHSKRFNTYQSRDYQNGWIRAAVEVNIPKGAERIRLTASEINQSFIIDELCIKPSGKRVRIDKKNGDILYDNYLISKQE